MRVELGAGERPAPGYLALDVNPRTADVIASAMHLPFRDGSVEGLRAVDVLEHISYRQTDDALREWARVLAPGAPIYVQVPDAWLIMRWFVQEPARMETWEGGLPCHPLRGAEWRLLGGHLDGKYCKPGDDFRWNAHYSLWSQATIEDALSRTGFDIQRLVTNRHPNVCCDAVRK